MKVKKIVFSPTGGTEKVAGIIAKNISQDIITIDLCNPNLDFKNQAIEKDDLTIIAMPSYGERAPQTATERLKQIKGNNSKTIIVCVYGNRAYEDTLAEMQDAANDSGFKVIAGISAVARHSIVPKYGEGRPDQKDEQILKEFTKDILNKNKDKISKIPGNRPYKKLTNTPLVPKPNKKCTKCGICAKICPVKAIDPVTFKANPKKCISCMRCVSKCPENARAVNKALLAIVTKALERPCKTRKENELFILNSIFEN